MDLRHFFEGMMGRELAASAFLATLLEHDRAFRREFLALGLKGADPPFASAPPEQVRVEDGRTGYGPMDITLEWPSTFVLIENKLSSGTKMDGQLLRYYQSVVHHWPEKRIAALYLAPTTAIGGSEVALVAGSPEFRGRQGQPGRLSDATGTVAWEEVAGLPHDPPQPDDWFARSGLDAIRREIKDIGEPLPPDAQRELVRDIVQAAMQRLQSKVPAVQLTQWHSLGQEAICTAKAPVTLFVTAIFDVVQGPSYGLHDVVGDSGVRLRVDTSLSLPPWVATSSALGRAWQELKRAGSMDVPGVGRHILRGDTSFVCSEPWTDTPAELVDYLVERGWRVTEFLRPYYAMSTAGG